MISKERLNEWLVGLEAQLKEQEATMNATKGAIQMIHQLLGESEEPEKEE